MAKYELSPNLITNRKSKHTRLLVCLLFFFRKPVCLHGMYNILLTVTRFGVFAYCNNEVERPQFITF